VPLEHSGLVAMNYREEELETASHHSAVFSVLSQVLDKDELSRDEFEEKDRPRDDYINHDLLRSWFKKRLKVATEHRMSLREIWRNFCFEYQIYCSLPLFGNVVLRHVLQADPDWRGVTKTGDIKQKRYNLCWITDPPGTEEELDTFFSHIKEEKEKVEKVAPPKESVDPQAVPPPAPKSPTMFLDPVVLAKWWLKRLEPSDAAVCRMRMRDVYERFVAETEVNMPKALFGELSVRYVLSLPQFAEVVRKGKIHNKRYSLRWKNEARGSTGAGQWNNEPMSYRSAVKGDLKNEHVGLVSA